MPTITVETTPNPDSVKFTASSGRFREEGVAAFSTSEEAPPRSLAGHLFSIRGVDDVFVTPDFVTVSKQSEASWDEAVPEIKATLVEHLETAASAEGP